MLRYLRLGMDDTRAVSVRRWLVPVLRQVNDTRAASVRELLLSGPPLLLGLPFAVSAWRYHHNLPIDEAD